MGRKKKPLHENFRDYTQEEIASIKRNHCLAHNCPYMSIVNSRLTKSQSNKDILLNNKYCNYIVIAKHSRGCMPDVCEHWKDTKVKKRANIAL